MRQGRFAPDWAAIPSASFFAKLGQQPTPAFSRKLWMSRQKPMGVGWHFKDCSEGGGLHPRLGFSSSWEMKGPTGWHCRCLLFLCLPFLSFVRSLLNIKNAREPGKQQEWQPGVCSQMPSTAGPGVPEHCLCFSRPGGNRAAVQITEAGYSGCKEIHILVN